jgi:hypothetical protein
MREVEYEDAYYFVRAGGGSAPTKTNDAQLAALREVCQCDDGDTHMLAVLEVFMNGLAAAILTLMLPWYHSQRHHRTLCFMS